MSEDRDRKDTVSDDIDLINLLDRTYAFFRRFGKIFIVAIVIGILLGGLVYFVSPKIYQSKLILHSSYLTNQEELEIIDYWNQLLQRNEHNILASLLNCPQSLLSGLVSLEGVEIQKNYSSTDPNGFYITARVKDNSILPPLQQAIVFGLNNTEFVKQKISEKRRDLEQLINRTENEVQELDSLKRSLELSAGKNTTILLNIGSINKDLADLNEKSVGYRSELKSLSSLQVLQGFIPLNTPVSRSLRVSILLGVVFTIAVAYVYSLLKVIEDRLKKRIKSNARE